VKKLVASLAIVFATALGAASPALAQQYPPSLSVIVIVSDGTVVVTVTGCQVGESVSIVVTGPGGGVVVSVVVTCSATGGAGAMPRQTAGGTATTSFPTPTTPGTYTVTATGQASGLVGSTTFTIAAAQAATTTTAAPAGGALPTTGSDNTPMLWIASSAIVVGAGLSIVAWKRRHPAAA
jgi:LPXTG-motif cell wall-anchored protein